MANRTKILFLLRSYNDIDHIVPIIWKALGYGLKCYYIFVDNDFSDDYRINFVRSRGARQITTSFLIDYHQITRKRIPFYFLRRIVDRVVALGVGTKILLTYKIDSVVNEWSGPYGREMAEYFLRSATLLRIPRFCVPHGYHYWTNTVINESVRTYVKKHGQLPSFSNRRQYTAYIVQTNNIRQYYLAHRMPPKTIYVLGSTRFSREWQKINSEICPKSSLAMTVRQPCNVLFFVPDWSYYIDRAATISLLLGVAQLTNICLLIKQNTRGTGGLTPTEIESLDSPTSDYIVIGDEHHSTDLISQSHCVINFASSIGFEAMLQGKVVCNPCYLTANNTIFDKSGAVIDTFSKSETLRFVASISEGRKNFPGQDIVSRFLLEHVYAGTEKTEVLDRYVQLIANMDGVVFNR